MASERGSAPDPAGDAALPRPLAGSFSFEPTARPGGMPPGPPAAEYSRQIRLVRVREYQREVVESGARFKLLLCGRRWGKTTVGLVAASQGHGAPTGEEGHLRGALDGARIGWVVPSEDHPAATEVWGDLKKALGPLALSTSEEQRKILVAGGGSVSVWSGYDPDAWTSALCSGKGCGRRCGRR